MTDDMQNKPLLDVQNLTVRFAIKRGGLFGKAKHLYAVDDISFQIKRDKMVHFKIVAILQLVLQEQDQHLI